jgi:hypothetical protein
MCSGGSSNKKLGSKEYRDMALQQGSPSVRKRLEEQLEAARQGLSAAEEKFNRGGADVRGQAQTQVREAEKELQHQSTHPENFSPPGTVMRDPDLTAYLNRPASKFSPFQGMLERRRRIFRGSAAPGDGL